MANFIMPESEEGMVDKLIILDFASGINTREDTLRLGRQWSLPDPGSGSNLPSPHENVLSKLSRSLTFLEMYLEDPDKSLVLKCGCFSSSCRI
ncbi:hypothetical protein LIER_29828 [Lithospermum erythrorhizon]|uniref:Uncharacterized protein n=1 Tax=Lithospermum erythrorhizon TaxID=34254 RepID=A0AAV3RRE7_LITER